MLSTIILIAVKSLTLTFLFYHLCSKSLIYGAGISFDLNNAKDRENVILSCRMDTPSNLQKTKYCAVWTVKRQQSTGKQYIRIRSDGGIDYDALDDDYSCRVRRPNNLDAPSGKLVFDLQLTAWEQDWDLFFDNSSKFKCYFCNHCTYEGHDVYWVDRGINDYSGREFTSQRHVTALCGGDYSGKHDDIDEPSTLVREYDVSIVSEDRSRKIQYSDCQKVQPNNPESCAFVQVGERNCTGLTFCRQYPKGKKIKKCPSNEAGCATRITGVWSDWSPYYPSKCPGSAATCFPSKKCRYRQCSNPPSFPNLDSCEGEVVESSYCTVNCGILNLITPYLIYGGGGLAGLIFAIAICIIVFGKDDDSRRVVPSSTKAAAKKQLRIQAEEGQATGRRGSYAKSFKSGGSNRSERKKSKKNKKGKRKQGRNKPTKKPKSSAARHSVDS